MAGSCPGGRSNPRWSSTSWCATSTSPPARPCRDRKSTRLNSSHGYISYAVFCLKKKTLTDQPYVYKLYIICEKSRRTDAMQQTPGYQILHLLLPRLDELLSERYRTPRYAMNICV